MARVYMDEYSGGHVSQRIRERIKDPADQAKVVAIVKTLLTMEAPLEAVGEYMWYINVERIARIVMRGHSVRTVYSFNESFPGGTEYRIAGRRILRS